jgi:hypothetical protein
MHVTRFVLQRDTCNCGAYIGNYIRLECVGLFTDDVALFLLLITEQLEWVLKLAYLLVISYYT